MAYVLGDDRIIVVGKEDFLRDLAGYARLARDLREGSAGSLDVWAQRCVKLYEGRMEAVSHMAQMLGIYFQLEAEIRRQDNILRGEEGV